MIKLILIIYILLTFGFFYFQESFIFSPDDSPKDSIKNCEYLESYEELLPFGEYETKFYLKDNNEKEIIVFYHGGVGNLCHREKIVSLFEKQDKDILLVEYKSYHIEVLDPSKKSFIEDVENTINYLENKKYENIILVGRGLGTGPLTTHIKKDKNNINDILLISPFNSIAEILQEKFFILPVKWILTNNFDNSLNLKDYDKDITILVAENDKNIKVKYSKNLQNSLNSDIQFITIKNTDYNILIESSEFEKEIKKFLKKYK